MWFNYQQFHSYHFAQGGSMNIIQFAGFRQDEVDAMMPILVETLGLEHRVYSVCPGAAVLLYDEKGKRQGSGKMIIIPGFDAIRAKLSLLNDLSQKFGVPVTCNMAEVKLAVGRDLF